MINLTVDVAVIGAGTAGMVAYSAAKSHDKRVVLIEGGPYGTTCARVGCMPSKLLIAAADAAHAIGHAPGFGVHAGPMRIDGREVMARVRAERDRFVDFVLDGIDNIAPADRLRGHARFIGRNSLQIDDHTVVNAGRIVIATGSSPNLPDALRGVGDRLISSDDIFEWTDLPKSVAVIGTGVIGLELGQALHRLGVRVALFGRSGKLGQLSDPAVLNAAIKCLGDELDLRLNSQVLGAERDGGQVSLRWSGADSSERTERFDYLLAATGRAPNVSRLGLEHAGLELDAAGVPRFDPVTMQCGDSAIFIAGDADNERPVLHEAADQGRIAGDNAGRFPDVRPGLRRTPFSIAFTDPQIAVVGQPHRVAKDQHVVIGEVSFENQGRSRAMRQNCGVLRVYATIGSGHFIGAEMIGPRNEHLAHLLAWACQNKMTIAQMLDMPFYHPVIEEGLRTALRDAKKKLLHGLPPIDRCTDCTPGV
ncbi:MAG: dihydrolipoyl dehydrogenase [Burkholderiales bacterium RIFCSPLOWO2_02_FULL_57_36]|nr:MAG: dihydrolipoyl dehydrogenase [Burkholderiales bacterium RIFCSPLOWO2_02_FULL_57_36]